MVLSIPLVERLIRSAARVKALTDLRQPIWHSDDGWMSFGNAGRFSFDQRSPDEELAFEAKWNNETSRVAERYMVQFMSSLSDGPQATLDVIARIELDRERAWARYERQNRDVRDTNNEAMQNDRSFYNVLCTVRLISTIVVTAVPAVMMLAVGPGFALALPAIGMTSSTVGGMGLVSLGYSIFSAGGGALEEAGALDAVGAVAIETGQELSEKGSELLHLAGKAFALSNKAQLTNLAKQIDRHSEELGNAVTAKARQRAGEALNIMKESQGQALKGLARSKGVAVTGKILHRGLPVVYAAKDVIDDLRRFE